MPCFQVLNVPFYRNKWVSVSEDGRQSGWAAESFPGEVRQDGLEASTISVPSHNDICYIINWKTPHGAWNDTSKEKCYRMQILQLLSQMLYQPADVMFVGKENKYIEMWQSA